MLTKRELAQARAAGYKRFEAVKPLPIVERELRVASRQPKTWWRRVLMTSLALGILTFLIIVSSSWTSVNRMGGELFAFLAGFGMVYALLAGPIWTADCLARERREGTLGLLFLTNLRSYDVVLGKMAAASLDMVLGLLAVMPLMTIPLLLGGVGLEHVGVVTFSTVNILFFSLSIGVLGSALFASGRAAIGLTILTLAFLMFGVPMIGEGIFNLHLESREAAFFYLLCPMQTMALTLEGLSRPNTFAFWVNAGGMHLFGWGCLAVACLRTRRSWREEPASAFIVKWAKRWLYLGKRTALARRQWKRTLERNPVAWLEGRDVLQSRALGALVFTCSVIWACGVYEAPHDWLDDDAGIPWALLAHYTLCVWIAIQAPRRLADDKQSGALELLLCTPVTPRDAVRGIMCVLRRRFGATMLWLLSLDALLLVGFFYTRTISQGILSHDTFLLALCGFLVFPVQAWAVAKVGIYQGLMQGNSVRATISLVWKLGLLPWVMFIMSIMILEAYRSAFGAPGFRDWMLFITWTACHLVPCVLFGLQASWHLRRDFRYYAVHPAPKWWRFWHRFKRRSQPLASVRAGLAN